MTPSLHEELDAIVSAIHPWGFDIQLKDGCIGFVDNAKNPSWAGGESGPTIGDAIRVVVTDDDREPFRASALEQDIAIARELRES